MAGAKPCRSGVDSGPVVVVGLGNFLTNHGTLSPGGAGTILATLLNGNFSQPGSKIEVAISASTA